MARAKEKPLYQPPADYEDDYWVWSLQQAELLRLGRFNELDLPNLIEEIEEMAASVRRALESSYRVLLMHLLKWEFQPERRTRSWLLTIERERGNILDFETDNKSLRNDAPLLIRSAYRRARNEAAKATGLKKVHFPEDCPYTHSEIAQEDWLPGIPHPGEDTLPPIDD
jgi:hypothetical protein